MSGIRYDTVLERCFPDTEQVLMSFVWRHVLGPTGGHLFKPDSPDPIRLAQVKDVMEMVVSGRKYEVMLLRLQGKTVGEIAMLLSISKSAVRCHYRRAVIQVRKALGLEPSSVLPPV